jgi:hypothetical protein
MDEQFTHKELLMEIRDDVKAMGQSLAVLTSQNLDSRVNHIEQWMDKVDGRMSLLTAGVVFLGAIATVCGVILAAIKFMNGG